MLGAQLRGPLLQRRPGKLGATPKSEITLTAGFAWLSADNRWRTSRALELTVRVSSAMSAALAILLRRDMGVTVF